MAAWIHGKIIANKQWHEHLFSVQVQPATPLQFSAGQYVRLGLPAIDEASASPLIATSEPILSHRAYSMVNAPEQPELEFYIAAVPGGEFSPRLQTLPVGETVHISQPTTGFFTLEHVPVGDTLWLIATGTGLGPYLSMLKTATPWQRYQRIVVVHGVRHQRDLGYQDWLQALQLEHPRQFCYQPVLSQPALSQLGSQPEPAHADTANPIPYLTGRIPALIRNGSLERNTGALINANAQIMLCGNPAMIADTRAVLAERELRINLKRKPGNITLEQYWK